MAAFYVWDHLCPPPQKNSKCTCHQKLRMGVCRPPSLWGRSCRLYSSSLRWHQATKSASPSLPWAGLPTAALAALLEGLFASRAEREASSASPSPAAPTPPPNPAHLQPPDTVIWLWTQWRGAQGERLLMGTDRTWGQEGGWNKARQRRDGGGGGDWPDDEGLISPFVLMVFHLPRACEWSRLMADRG